MGKVQKPFIAARIPIGLEEALEKHTKSTGESKTAALIHALGRYVGWSQDKEVKPSASDRLSLLEERVKKLEQLMQTPQQTSLLELSHAIDDDNKVDKGLTVPKTDNSDNKVIEVDQENTIEALTPANNTDNTVIKNKNQDKIGDTSATVINADNKNDNKALQPMTHKEFAKLTGMNPETVRSKTKGGIAREVTWEGKKFKPQKIGKNWKWFEITTDNSFIN